MVQKSKTGMVARFVHALEIAHKFIIARIIDGGTGSEKCLQTGIVEGQQFLKGVTAPLERTHLGVHRITGDAEGSPYFTVAITVRVQRDDLFQVHWIKCVGHIVLLF